MKNYNVVSFLKINAIKDTARFQILPIQSVSVYEDVGMGIIGLWQGNRATVRIQCAVFKASIFRGVEMSVEKHVAVFKQRGYVCVE